MTIDFLANPERWDYPDPPHDPDPMRYLSPEARAIAEAETMRQKAMIADFQANAGHGLRRRGLTSRASEHVSGR
jgi:hypothetical protein